MIGTTIDVFLKCLARFRAIADFPVPQTPLMKISLFPFSISSRISLTTSAWVLSLEKRRGRSGWSVVGVRLSEETGDSKLELPDSGLEVLLYRDHINKNRVFYL